MPAPYSRLIKVTFVIFEKSIVAFDRTKRRSYIQYKRLQSYLFT